MSRPNHQFFGTPSTNLSHPARLSNSSHFFFGARFVFNNLEPVPQARISTGLEQKDGDGFDNELKEQYKAKLEELSKKIEALDRNRKTPSEIKEEFKKQKAQLLKEAFDKALSKIAQTPVTYDQAAQDDQVGEKLKNIYETYLEKSAEDIDKAVDQYFQKKTQNTTQTSEALTAATKPGDLNSLNPEISRLEQAKASRQKILSSSQQSRRELFSSEDQEVLAYRQTISKIESKTSPTDGIINDYDDGFNPFNDVTDENNPTRSRLNGYLFATYIYNGGGEAGNMAVDQSLSESSKLYQLYNPHWFTEGRLTSEHLSQGMGLEPYFKSAIEQKYSKFESVIGFIAAFEKMIDEDMKNNPQKVPYLKYVRSMFDQIKSNKGLQDKEEEQLKLLFSIRSPGKYVSETLKTDPNWKLAFNKADQLTNPNGGKIDDYPGVDYPGESDNNKNNRTRSMLNGYLYSVYLLNDKNDQKMPAMNQQFDRAVKIFKDSSTWKSLTLDEDFSQSDLENDPEGKKDGFGLGKYLKDVDKKSKYDSVQAAMAGLLKQTETLNNPSNPAEPLPEPQKENYRKYLLSFFDQISKTQSEQDQLKNLSALRLPGEALEYLADKESENYFNLMIEAAKQHNQFKFSEALTKQFSEKQDSDKYEALGGEAFTEIETFIDNRSKADIKSLNDKFQELSNKNKTKKTPEDFTALTKAVEATKRKFAEAQEVSANPNFKTAVESKYLEKLVAAEKSYLERMAEIEAKLQEGDKKSSKKGTIPASTSSSSSESGSSTSSSGSESSEIHSNEDPYTTNWKNAREVTPSMEDYSGPLTVDSGDPAEKVIGYSLKGKHLTTLKNNTEVIRTEQDSKVPALKVDDRVFVRVTYKDKKIWIKEIELNKKDDGSIAPKPAPERQKTPEYPAPIDRDGYTVVWGNAPLTAPTSKEVGTFKTFTEAGYNVPLRNDKGEIIFYAPAGIALLRNATNVDHQARQIGNIKFVELYYQNQVLVWVDEKMLKFQPDPQLRS